MIVYGNSVSEEKHGMYFLCEGGYARASRHRMHLMRQHKLTDLFPIGKRFVLKAHDYRPNRNVVPYFTHPHDCWIAYNELMEPYSGKVVTVSKDEKDYHLLIELEPNVLAFADVVSFDGNTDVQFVPYKYNRRTKKIYGYVYSEQTLNPERQLAAKSL